MELEIVRYGDIRKQADIYCAICGKVGKDDEEVLANIAVLPTPWICRECAEKLIEVIDNWLKDEL